MLVFCRNWKTDPKVHIEIQWLTKIIIKKKTWKIHTSQQIPQIYSKQDSAVLENDRQIVHEVELGVKTYTQHLWSTNFGRGTKETQFSNWMDESLELLPSFVYCESCCYEHGWTNMLRAYCHFVCVYTEVEFLYHLVLLYLIFWGTTILFSIS